MRVIVDRDRCEGNAVCLGIAPDIFDLDDEDYAVVKTDPIPADQEALAELIARSQQVTIRHIFCGHVHRFTHGTWRGIPFSA